MNGRKGRKEWVKGKDGWIDGPMGKVGREGGRKRRMDEEREGDNLVPRPPRFLYYRYAVLKYKCQWRQIRFLLHHEKYLQLWTR